MKIIKISSVQKHETNPFVDGGMLIMKRGRTTIIAGSTSKVLVDVKTGESEGIALLHRYKEVDRDQFIKLYLGEVRSLFDLSKTGLKAFGFVLTCMRINDAEIYLNIPDMVKYCEWSTTAAAYRGIGELMANKIIAPSVKANLWFINPNIIFNGDRIAFIKEYRLKSNKQITGEQSELLLPEPEEENE